MNQNVKQAIQNTIDNHSVVLFMKGTKDRPQCGFSKQVVGVLRALTSDFFDVDVLADPELRDGIKIFSSWPTIPQLYIDGQFIGGCDIVLDLFKTQELHQLLSVKKAQSSPEIKVTDRAIEAFKQAASDDSDECIRISIDANLEHALAFDNQRADDFLLNIDNIKLIIDPYSAIRADGLAIDYVTEGLESGFSFINIKEPPAVKEISVEELAELKAQDTDFILLDVRPKAEAQIANISFAKLLCEMSDEELSGLNKDQKIVFHCHHGARSQRVAQEFRAKGFVNVANLSGGVDAWSKRIDKSVPLY